MQPAHLLKLHNSVDWAFVGVDDESSFPLLEIRAGRQAESRSRGSRRSRLGHDETVEAVRSLT